MLQLIMEASECAPHGARKIVLYERAVDSGLGVFLGMIRFEKQPSRILKDIGFDKDDLFQFGFNESQRHSPDMVVPPLIWFPLPKINRIVSP